MQKRAVVVSVAAALLGLAAAALGIAAEHFKHKAFVGRSGDALHCEYRRTPALGCGVLAAALSLAAVALVTAASGCFSRCGAAVPAAERGRALGRKVLANLAWLLVLAAAAIFLSGAARNAGGTRTLVGRRRHGRGGRGTDFVCDEVIRDGVFVLASVAAAIGVAFAIAVYVDIERHRDRAAKLRVAMGQPTYPAPPVAYPAQPPYTVDKAPSNANLEEQRA